MERGAVFRLQLVSSRCDATGCRSAAVEGIERVAGDVVVVVLYTFMRRINSMIFRCMLFIKRTNVEVNVHS